jgi:hypothetical protein
LENLALQEFQRSLSIQEKGIEVLEDQENGGTSA